MNSRIFNVAWFFRDTATVSVVVLLAATISGIVATNGRSGMAAILPSLVAAACCLLVFVPAIALRNCVFLGTNRILAGLAWRFPTSLATIMAIYTWDGVQRKCFITALLTCYFVTLPLESWLQIRQCHRTDGSVGSRN